MPDFIPPCIDTYVIDSPAGVEESKIARLAYSWGDMASAVVLSSGGAGEYPSSLFKCIQCQPRTVETVGPGSTRLVRGPFLRCSDLQGPDPHSRGARLGRRESERDAEEESPSQGTNGHEPESTLGGSGPGYGIPVRLRPGWIVAPPVALRCYLECWCQLVASVTM
jgi:hypothetical protein